MPAWREEEGRQRGLAVAGVGREGRSRGTAVSRASGTWLRPFALVRSSLPAAAEENPQHGEGTEPGAAPKKRKRKKQRVQE